MRNTNIKKYQRDIPEGMYTYIIESQGYYKIGKTSDLGVKMSTYDTYNPIYKIIDIIGYNCEAFLHNHFKHKRFRFEWFSLDQEDLNWIKVNREFLTFKKDPNVKSSNKARHKKEKVIITKNKFNDVKLKNIAINSYSPKEIKVDINKLKEFKKKERNGNLSYYRGKFVNPS